MEKRHIDAVSYLTDAVDRIVHGDFEEAVGLTENALDALAEDQQEPDVDPDFLTTCPDLYDTIIGFKAKRRLDIGDAFDLKLGFAMRRRCLGTGYAPPIKVPAPKALREIGCDTVNAYPLSALEAEINGNV